MNKFLTYVLVSSIFLLVVISAQAERQVSILASIRPLGFLAEEVVGDYGKVHILLNHSVSAHHYSLKVSDLQRLLSADIVLWIGEAMENFLEKPIIQNDVNPITAVNLSGLLWPPETVYEEYYNHRKRDPHLWLNPINNIPIIDALLVRLHQVAPENDVYYRNNAKQLKDALRQLDQRLMKKMKPLQAGSFIVNHPAYNHFVFHYGLNQLAYLALTPERHAGAKHLYQLRQQHSAYCVFSDYGVSAIGAKKLAKELDVPLFVLDPLGLKVLGKNLKIIKLIEQLAQGFHDCLTVKTS